MYERIVKPNHRKSPLVQALEKALAQYGIQYVYVQNRLTQGSETTRRFLVYLNHQGQDLPATADLERIARDGGLLEIVRRVLAEAGIVFLEVGMINTRRPVCGFFIETPTIS